MSNTNSISSYGLPIAAAALVIAGVGIAISSLKRDLQEPLSLAPPSPPVPVAKTYKISTLEVNYSSPAYILYPYSIAGRHFKVAFASTTPESIDALSKSQTINRQSAPSLSLLGRMKHFVLGVIELVPLVGAILVVAERYLLNPAMADNIQDARVSKALDATPQFGGYGYKSNPNVHLTDLTLRPNNLLLQALFGKDPSTQPGTGLHPF